MSWLSRLLDLFLPHPAPQPVPTPKPPPEPVPNAPGPLVTMLNEARARHGVPPLMEYTEVVASAWDQSVFQARRDRIGHDGPGPLATTSDRLAAHGIRGRACGEIVAEGPTGFTFETAVEGWVSPKDPAHRAILLNPQYTAAGAATARSGSGNLYCTAVFIA